MVVTLLGRRLVSSTLYAFKLPKLGPFMAQNWSSHGPPNWLFRNINPMGPQPMGKFLCHGGGGGRNQPLYPRMHQTIDLR